MKISYDQGVHYLGDSREVLSEIQNSSVDLVVTDPPYFIDGMGDDWNADQLQKSSSKASIIGGRPVGMKFSKTQGREFEVFMAEISAQLLRVLKPGGFFISFSQARLYHRLAVAAEDAGFEIRDMLAWHHNGQAKAFSQVHFIKRMKNLSDDTKIRLSNEMAHLKTAQLKPQLEPMILAQKPKEGTLVENWVKYGVGLMDSRQSLDLDFPGNLMKVGKPGKVERGEGNTHLTVKPVTLLEHLIRLFSQEGQVVLDPFLGSGSTSVSAVKSGRRFVGIERDPNYFQISNRRLEQALSDQGQRLF